MNEESAENASAFQPIRAIDYTIIIVRDMDAMRRFYETVLGFSLQRMLSSGWVEFRIGGSTLALATPGRTAAGSPVPVGSAALLLAFRASVAEVDACAAELVQQGIDLVSPPTNQSFGHRTLFFRDPDGNLLEVFADIQVPVMRCTSQGARRRSMGRSDDAQSLRVVTSPLPKGWDRRRR